jgi:hypothetical protein
MTHLKRWIAVLAIGLAAAVLTQPAAAQDSKVEKAREIFRVMQADRIMDQMVEAAFGQMGAMMQQQHPDLPQGALAIVREEISATLRQSLPELVEQMAQVYEDVFTEEELDAMLDFYRGPAGQSLLNKMPQVMARSMQFSQSWAISAFQDLPQRIEQRLRAEGYEL